MNRIREKVKDLIEVRKYDHLSDFLAEPSKTLEGYHYTPETSELMAKWLDAIVAAHDGTGAAKALAGYRGVGKSHFLATFGAMLAEPDLRAKVDDAHVSASLHHLKRRHYPVAHVRRGTAATFTEELKNAICQVTGSDPAQTEGTIENLVRMAGESSRGLPFVIIVDTAVERNSRVSRDDGELLGELAIAAKQNNVFIGVALDDDITDADGVNSAIAQYFTIDYLNQEHLYQIVDSHIFPKHAQTQNLIQQLYREFRETLPKFRYSEQRFNALYPLHPSILEVAPFVRYYAPSFALLGFASKAGERILGRPANSLISLDEVFDSVEPILRKSADLEESFKIYDEVLNEVISKIPVMQRLQSKLVLKALFILSLDGNGTSAGEISEATLIYDVADPERGINATLELLEAFSEAVPEGVWKKSEDSIETRFGIKVSGKDDLNSALETLADGVSFEVVPQVLRRVANDKFADWKLFGEAEEQSPDSMDCPFEWRGSLRTAKVVWNWEGSQSNGSETDFEGIRPDALVIINQTGSEIEEKVLAASDCIVSWNASPLTQDEMEILRRLFVLLNDTSLREKYGEQVRASGHTHMAAAEKIWDRVFFTDAELTVNGEEHQMSDGILQSESLGQLIGNQLSPFFEQRFPNHPEFEKPLTMDDVSMLVNDLFSGARGDTAEVQDLARAYAVPLGLVSEVDGEYVIENETELANLELSQKILARIDKESVGTVTLDEIDRELNVEPYGFAPETQRLFLAALVAQRQIEFITSAGDRINQRSLDLKIVWEDLSGVARPINVDFDYERLTGWARAISENANLAPFNSTKGRKEILEALSAWEDNWDESNVLDEFKQLPDEILNTNIWHVSTRVEKTFGSVVRSIKAVTEESVSLEEGLQRIAETFFDSTEELFERKKDLQLLKDFVSGNRIRDRIWSYLALCESTQNESIEGFRAELLRLIDDSYDLPSFEGNQKMEDLWGSFSEKFSEHFVVRHNAIMNSRQLKEEVDKILKGDEWWEFECLSRLPIFKDLHWQKARSILRRFRELECNFDVAENLKSHPFCACSFSLTKMGELAKLSHSLSHTIDLGRKSYRNTLFLLSDFVIMLVKEVVENDKDKDLKSEADALIALLKNQSPDAFTSTQLSILYSAMFSANISTSIDISLPDVNGLYTSEELRARLNEWVDDLPNEPILVKI